ARPVQHRSLPPTPLPGVPAVAARQDRDGATGQPRRRGGAGGVGALCRVRRPRAAPPRRDPAVLAAGPRACAGDAAVAARIVEAWSQPWCAARPPGAWCGAGPGAQRRGRALPPAAPRGRQAVIQILAGIATHSVALLLYPGLAAMVAFGILVELAWMRLSRRGSEWPELPRRRPSPVLGTIALCALLASVQLAAPFNPVPGEERSIVLASVGLAFTVWAELALTVEFVAEPGLLLVIQLCWLLAVLGPAVQPESLRPQVLGNVLVPALLPVKIACAFLYVLCLPALLRLWPLAAPGERRGRRRLDGRILTWFPNCGLFTTLFVTPSSDDL